MPEIKHQFTGGKMNKDVDERLVPNGEYRDAMNIQVSTSEGSDVGTIQNILGNSLVAGQDFIGQNSVCVGSIADEKNDALYWFSSGAENYAVPGGGVSIDTNAFDESSPQGVWMNHKDMILQLKGDVVTPVFVSGLTASAYTIYQTGTNLSWDSSANTITFPPSADVTELVVGMTLQGDSTVQQQSYIGMVIDSIDAATNTIVISGDITWLDLVIDQQSEMGTKLFFTSIGFSESGGVLDFNSDNLITGINIVDDMLFWTDGINEPKKINIPRSIEGTHIEGLTNTLLVNNAQGYTGYESDGVTLAVGINKEVEKKHITVIKNAPSKPPTLTPLTDLRQDTANGLAVNVDFSDGAATQPAQKIKGDTLNISVSSDISTDPPNILEADVILLNSVGSSLYLPDNYEVRALVNTATANGIYMELNITIVSISTLTPLVAATYDVVVLEEGYNLFERKLPRFAYRYRYEDGEYSAIGPFSEVAFVPGSFSYHPTEAYNKGMVNNLKSLKLQDFVAHDLPEDVVQIDLLYKNETSPSIYIVKSIKPTDESWLAPGSAPATDMYPNGTLGSYEITSENIYATLSSNQSLRPWDNVPRAALAQDVIGSRIVYANYTQNYDLQNQPTILAGLDSRELSAIEVVGQRSIKSLRTYNVGIVYGDKYGRETPVFADKLSNQIVPKSNAGFPSLLRAEVTSEHPLWAEYYKFFVKETSNEYYNLALGRLYNAEDGNIWLAFPSIDRNKVDEDTYLILKKGIGDTPVSEEARYKIVAIENEAPDYIKTSFTTIARPLVDLNTNAVFGGSGADNEPKLPAVGAVSFYIDFIFWTDDVSVQYGLGMPNLLTQWGEKGSSEQLYVAFIGNIDGSAKRSKEYLITNVTHIDAPSASETDKEVFEVFISTPIIAGDEWVSTNNPHVTIHKPVITKKEIINKPEFDGRFFVKIKSDNSTDTLLSTPPTEDITWRITASTGIYYFRDNNASQITASDEVLISTAGGLGPTTNVVSGLSSRSYKEEHWNGLLTFGGPSYKGAWFIDQAAYAGTQSSTTSVYSGAYTTTTHSDLESTQEYCEAPNIWGNYDCDPFQHGTGMSNGTQFKTGISSHTSTGLANNLEHRLTLSYSYILDIYDYPISHYGWDIGSDNNPAEVSWKPFVSQIKEGSKFRMGGDTSKTYTITSVTTDRLYNYRARLPSAYITGGRVSHGNPDWSKSKWQYDWARPGNRRVAYNIVYTIDGGDLADDLLDNPALVGVDAVTSAQFQFLEPYTTSGEEPIDEYPAIFETEPKEDTNLDIYYEASGRIPTSINNGNGEMFVSLGAVLRINSEFFNAYEDGITVAAWGGFDMAGNYKDNIIKISSNIELSTPVIYDDFPWAIGPLAFDNPDGSTTYMELTEIVWDTITDNNSNSITFGQDFDIITGLQVEPLNKIGLSWFNCWDFGNGVESNRVGDTYNKPFLLNGAKASTTLDQKYEKEVKKYGLIYSGLYNSTSGVNNLNQFIAAEKITKDINPIYGSIQKLHSRVTADGDLIALCEDRVLKILANRDAVFNADGNPQLLATENVLGQVLPYAGDYGISKNPESFASESYRLYFTDKIRGTVMRLSKDGLTPISSHGMKDWFRDNLKLSNKLIGSYDDKKDEYNITLIDRKIDSPKLGLVSDPKTVSFREDVKGWVSFKSFIPQNATSCANEYYTHQNDRLWRHHVEKFDAQGREIGRNTFYYIPSNSSFNVVLNDVPGSIKSFSTINYEGSQSRVEQFIVDVSTGLTDGEYYNLEEKKGWYVGSIFTNKESGTINEFIEKEGKWFNYIKGKTIQHAAQYISLNTDGSSTFDQASFAIQGLGQLTASPVQITVFGCTVVDSCNYNAGANSNDGSCIPATHGCTDPTANNYDSHACIDDGSCMIVGCTDSLAFNYNPMAIADDGSCIPIVNGCMHSLAFNYDANANVDDGSCIGIIVGCMLVDSDNYYSQANTDDGTCTWVGCIDPTANNFGWYGWIYPSFPAPSMSYMQASSLYGWQDDGTCTYTVDGCTDSNVINYDPLATDDDGTCIYIVYGCTDSTAANYDSWATDDDGHCTVAGCTNPVSPNYDSSANTDDGSCITATFGCTDSLATNYDPTATVDDTSCTFIYGCMDSIANNYDSNAGVDDSSCTYNYGCTNGAACNYDSTATMDDGSCSNANCTGCMDATALNYGLDTTAMSGVFADGPTCNNNSTGASTAGCQYDCSGVSSYNGGTDFGCCEYSQVPGCMNFYACNYDVTAGSDDGSCEYTSCVGCFDEFSDNYDAIFTGGCQSPPTFDVNSTGFYDCCVTCIYGCTDSTASNYNSSATCEATAGLPGTGVCTACVYGCMDSTMFNYNTSATCTITPFGIEAVCTPYVYGCTNSLATNYNSAANVSVGGCVFVIDADGDVGP